MLTAAAALLTYAAAETVATALYRARRIEPPTFWVYERRGEGLRFDPVTGYRLPRVERRFARISGGRAVYVGRHRGNAQGFPSPQDFEPRRGATTVRRLAVFGDSYTSAQYLPASWTDRVAAARPDLELLDFSVDGGGLGNWWSTLLRHVVPEGYELDGVVFAVWGDDLRRPFTVADEGPTGPLLGRARGWEPADLPATQEDARALLRPLGGPQAAPNAEGAWSLDADAFDAALAGAWTPPVPRSSAPYLARSLLRAIAAPASAPPSPQEAALRAGPAARVAEIREALARAGLPVVVVRVPSLDDLLVPGFRPPPGDVREFAAALGADLLDGAEAFRGLDDDAVRACWLPGDGHWNAAGSDRFAAFVGPRLARRPSR